MSGESHDPGKAVEMPVEAEDVFDVMDPHDSKVNGIPCGQVWVADDDFSFPLYKFSPTDKGAGIFRALICW